MLNNPITKEIQGEPSYGEKDNNRRKRGNNKWN